MEKATKEACRILFVEDNPGDARLLREMLDEAGPGAFHLDHCESLATCLAAAGRTSYSLVLLDLGLPDSLGLETFRRVFEQVKNTPTVVLSGLDDDQLAVAAVQEGTDDYIPKRDLTPRLLVRSMRYAIERHALKQRAWFLATHDPLTGVYNRHYFNETIETEIARSSRYKHPIGFLMVDVDRFKEINDRLGHQTGDRVLRKVAEFLRKQLRTVDLVIRYGGDEFLIVLPETDGGAETIAERIQQAALSMDGAAGENPFPITLSVGASYWDSAIAKPIESVLAEADKAMYEQKRLKALRESTRDDIQRMKFTTAIPNREQGAESSSARQG
jgi:diguanylate cyclase (GGDEF)-like protein